MAIGSPERNLQAKCRSRSPRSHRLCQLDDSHNMNLVPVHRYGPITWSARKEGEHTIQTETDPGGVPHETGDARFQTERAAGQLTQWWLDRARDEAAQVAPKAAEYGSNSLAQMGRKMAQLQGRQVGDEEALELGCWAYMIGKVERWTDAVMRGERPSDDTLHDIAVYTKMAQRIRATGDWPGVDA